MDVFIPDEELWTHAGCGRRIDVLREFVADKSQYLLMVRDRLESGGMSIEDPVAVVEYQEPDDEFANFGRIPLLGAVVDKNRVGPEKTFLEITGDRVDFIIMANFVDTSDPDFFNRKSRYCPVYYGLWTMPNMPEPPDRLGIVIEPVESAYECLG